MKIALVTVLLVACGGSAKPEPAKPEPGQDSGPTASVQAAQHNDEGKKAMFDGNYALASTEFREAVARSPEPKYFFNLCTALFQEGKYAEAQVACEAVDAHAPPADLSGKAHALLGKIQGEAKTTSPAPEVKPMTGMGTQAEIAAKVNQEGVDLMFAQKFAEATTKFRDAVARVPEPKYFFNLCTSLYQEGKFAEALTACDAVSKNNPPATLQSKADKMTARIQAEAKAQGIQMSPK